jgi:anthranilate phosphoribosyltransferase
VNGNEPLKKYRLQPNDFVLPQYSLISLRGGDKKHNAEIALEVLQGTTGSARDVVIANAALGIYIGGKTKTILEGKQKAEESIDSGKAFEKLKQLVHYTDQA